LIILRERILVLDFDGPAQSTNYITTKKTQAETRWWAIFFLSGGSIIFEFEKEEG
jgi:hypothetical protein